MHTKQPSVKPILIFTWGNPSRGDDALGTQVYDRLLHQDLRDVELLTDFQLQIEHAVDLDNRECILFVDAGASGAEPFDFYQLVSSCDESYTTHAMSPQSLLAVYEKVHHQAPPPAFMLEIRGYEFGLGLPLSNKAATNLSAAMRLIERLLADTDTDTWLKLAGS